MIRRIRNADKTTLTALVTQTVLCLLLLPASAGDLVAIGGIVAVWVLVCGALLWTVPVPK